MTSSKSRSNRSKKASYNPASETDRVLGILQIYNDHADYINSLTLSTQHNDAQPVLSMSFLGNLGRFGNQIFQYAYLRICAEKSGAKVECGSWIGQTLFGHYDAPVSRRLPPAIEHREIGERRLIGESFFDYIPEYIPYIEKVSGSPSLRIDSHHLETGLVNVDLWGFFQFHTKSLRPYQAYFRSLYQPVDDLKIALEKSFAILQSKGKTVVGVHVRRGEYLTFPQPRYALPVPSEWYRQWLAKIWPTLQEPVLFVCSDDLKNVLADFEDYSPITFKDLKIELPDRLGGLELGFYVDFFMLSHCDIVATSNSTFGFAACLLNESGFQFFRPDWNTTKNFVKFDPWDSNPLIYIRDEGAKFSKNLVDIARVAYANSGILGVLKSLFIYAPIGYAKLSGLRYFFAYKTNGAWGVFKAILSPLGLNSSRKIESERATQLDC